MSEIKESLESPFHKKILEIIREDNSTEVKVNKKYIESIVDTLPGGLLIYQIKDNKCKNLYISPKIPRVLGMTMSEYMEKAYTVDFVCEYDREFLRNAYHKSIENLSDMDINVRFLHKDGKSIWVNINSRVIMSNDKMAVYCGVMQEVSSSSLIYRELLDEVDEMICVWEKETKTLIFVNRALERKLEESPGLMNKLLKYGAEYIGAIPNKDDGYNVINNITSGKYIFDIKSKNVDIFGREAVIACISDVTEKNMLQSRFDNFVKTFACSCLKYKNDKNWTVVEANDMFYDIIGYTPREFRELKNNSFSAIVPEKQAIKLNNSANNNGNYSQKEYYIVTKDNGVKYIIDQSFIVEEDGEEYCYSTFIDITDRRLNEVLIEERYREEVNYRDAVLENYFAYLKLNITKGKVMDWKIDSDIDLAIKPGISIKELLAACEKAYSTSNTIRQIRKDLDVKTLIKNYKIGKKNYKLERYFASVNGESVWMSIQTSLRKNPYTKDMEAFLYIKNITDEKYINQAVLSEIKNEYDFIACINSHANKSVILDVHQKNLEKNYVCEDYNMEVERYANTMILQEHREELKRLLCLETILSELEKNEVYKPIYMEMQVAGQLKYKEYRFSYLDKEKGLILYSQKDVTEKEKQKYQNKIDLFRNVNDNEIKKVLTDYVDKIDKFKSDIISQVHLNDLTGLLSTNGFAMEVNNYLAKDPDADYYIVIRDINNFKVFNELYGRDKGNEFLKYFADHFSHYISEAGGICGHLGADDFVSCYKGCSIDVFNEISDKMSRAISKFPIDYRFITTAGIYKVEDINMPVTAMCDRARLALTSAKENAHSFEVYNDTMRIGVLHSQEVVNNFANALKERQIKVYLQPQYNINTGRIVGAEALTRWAHPEKGIISPGEFIPILENTGLISSLDRFVTEEVFKIMKTLSENFRGAMPPSIAVNFSRMDILNPGTLSYVENIRTKHNMPTSSIRIEITESMYVSQPSFMIKFVDKLRKRGYKVEMDDFGSGYSSLNSLKNFDIDLLKLDMDFMSSFNTDKGNKIIKSVISMADAIGIPVLTEGVETAEQRDFLKSIGCNYVQGYYYGKPMPVEDYIELIMSSEFEYIK